jgi:hypothetical protein
MWQDRLSIRFLFLIDAKILLVRTNIYIYIKVIHIP